MSRTLENASTDGISSLSIELKRAFWLQLDRLKRNHSFQQTPTEEGLLVMMDENAWTGNRTEGEGYTENQVLGAHGHV